MDFAFSFNFFEENKVKEFLDFLLKRTKVYTLVS